MSLLNGGNAEKVGDIASLKRKNYTFASQVICLIMISNCTCFYESPSSLQVMVLCACCIVGWSD